MSSDDAINVEIAIEFEIASMNRIQYIALIRRKASRTNQEKWWRGAVGRCVLQLLFKFNMIPK